MNVLISEIDNYLQEKTDIKDYQKAKTTKGFFFRNLHINVYDQQKLIPIIDTLLSQFLKK